MIPSITASVPLRLNNSDSSEGSKSLPEASNDSQFHVAPVIPPNRCDWVCRSVDFLGLHFDLPVAPNGRATGGRICKSPLQRRIAMTTQHKSIVRRVFALALVVSCLAV